MSDFLSEALSIAKLTLECLKTFIEVEKTYAESSRAKNEYLARLLERIVQALPKVMEGMGIYVGGPPSPKPMSEEEATALKIRRIIDLAEGLKTEDLEALINDLNAVLSRKKGGKE